MQAVSAGIRPQLERVQELGDKPMRAAVLSVTQQQKLASCTALLKEAAMVYGFALHIDPEVGEAASGVGCSHHVQTVTERSCRTCSLSGTHKTT